MSPNVAMGRWPLRSAALKDPPSAQLLNRGAVVDDPVAPQRPQRRSLRSPELQRRPPNRNITKKEPGAPPRRPAQVEMRRAKLFGDPRQGIKNTIRQPEMSKREHDVESTPRPVRSRPAPMCSDPVAANSSTARAPSVGPQRNSLNRKIDGSRRSSSADFCENEMVAAAGHARCQFARARLGSPAPRDKDHDRASRKCRSESMT